MRESSNLWNMKKKNKKGHNGSVVLVPICIMIVQVNIIYVYVKNIRYKEILNLPENRVDVIGVEQESLREIDDRKTTINKLRVGVCQEKR